MNLHPPVARRAPIHTIHAVAAAVALCALACVQRVPGALAAEPAGPAGPVRVATLLPYVADALAPMPERAVVVASVRRSSIDVPPAGMIDLGSPHAPSFERLAESGAQLVVGDAAMHATMTEKLSRGGAEVLLIGSGSVDETLSGLAAVGRRVGAMAEMEPAIAQARAGIAAATLGEPVATLPFFGAPGNFLVITERTWLGDLLGKLNFRNLAGGSTGKETYPGYVLVSDEVLASMRPALVLVIAHGDPEAIRGAFARRAAAGGPWQSLQDAQLGVHVLDPEQFGVNPGLGLPETARRLRALALPETAAR
jgi:ABC-type Fe3+-hydroxamate transport system substrate-binding protein